MRSPLIAILIIILSLAQFACANRSNLVEGIRSFRAEDYRKAFVRLKPEAIKGQADAQYAVGYMYYYGQGVVESRKKAWYWINKAAQAGQSEAVAAIAILKQQPENIMP
ncbi:sel1 repeat family protein [Legionella jordanis]|uniref:Sel-1 protein n=1 Tax=Legionella jordanis TaxID=456 RepID=A0A0W0V882_9GAMM|nr:sel1 repeat family protein [Legionella jordanis]KTD16298.1 Sel-1 protein [Legionella jordanis]RMX04488.1 sel1 repeat family protein [Legionella jordanis]RMX21034.1 sel1 repeat family protein [Legionella jordanis]VEH12244.1 Sel-1 protein [Legionella jordanis]HAT8713454.1 sel1 repeat family protein [Legionella jordanis]